jgi:peptidase E
MSKSYHQFILTGGGDSSCFKLIDLQFKKLLPPQANILLIPVASKRKNHAYCLRRIKYTFKHLKFNKVKLCDDLQTLSWDYLSLFHAIYIDGGNTFLLANYLHQSSLKKLFIKFLDQQGVINADSAGAIVLGKNILTAQIGENPDQMKMKLSHYRGLNLLNGWNVHCHFDPETEREEVLDYSKRFGKTLCLTESTAIFIKNNRGLVIGIGDLYLVSQTKIITIKPGQSFKL